MLKSIYLLVWILLFLFVICELADNVAERYERASIYALCDWYTFPNDVKRFLPIIIHNTQRSVVIKGFGNIDCTREEFKKVLFRLSTVAFVLRWSLPFSKKKILYISFSDCKRRIYILHAIATVFIMNWFTTRRGFWYPQFKK